MRGGCLGLPTSPWEPCSLAGSFLDRGERSSLLTWEARDPASSLPGALPPRYSHPLPLGPINRLRELPRAWGGTCSASPCRLLS